MAQTTFSKSNFNRPAPLWWRKLEDGLLMILIPAAVLIITSWGFENEALANKLTLLINVGLVAVIKFVGKMLANGEVYAQVEEKPGPVQHNTDTAEPNL